MTSIHQRCPEGETGRRVATAVLPNKLGIHARSAAQVVKAVARLRCNVTLHRDDRRADARSLMELLRLEARQGHTVRIEAEGRDAEEAICSIEALITNGFDEL
jgi:phosphotransferase system HPr (HPr) family protein